MAQAALAGWLGSGGCRPVAACNGCDGQRLFWVKFFIFSYMENFTKKDLYPLHPLHPSPLKTAPLVGWD